MSYNTTKYRSEDFIRALDRVVTIYQEIDSDGSIVARAKEMLAGLQCATPGYCTNQPCGCRTIGKPSGCRHGWHYCSPQIYHRDIAELAMGYLV